MRKLFLAAGVAALAISAPAVAEKGGKGNKGSQAKAAKVERGQAAQRADRPARVQRADKPARAGRAQQRHATAQRAERAPRAARTERPQQVRAAAPQRADRQARQQQRATDQRVRQNRALQQQAAAENRRAAQRDRRIADQSSQQSRRQAERRVQQERRSIQQAARPDRRLVQEQNRQFERFSRDGRRHVERQLEQRERLWNAQRRDARFAFRDWDDRDRWSRSRALGLINGCPPGLAKKNPPCIPPGQAKKLVGTRLPAAFASHALPRELRHLYPDTDRYYYRYGDGYVYRVDRRSNLISSLLPLIGAGLGIGQPFPYTSPAFHVPSHFQPFYPATDRYEYRYANGYVYEIDRFTGLISDVVPQYDHGYGVGQMLPASYSYYNLPDPYRQWYADDDDYYYRYAPGAIYRVNRENNMITSIVSLLAGNLGVGQQLPMGYDVYNVPFAYRDRYYDTSDHWYRYADGHIYQVDPTTRLITAVINALV